MIGRLGYILRPLGRFKLSILRMTFNAIVTRVCTPASIINFLSNEDTSPFRARFFIIRHGYREQKAALHYQKQNPMKIFFMKIYVFRLNRR